MMHKLNWYVLVDQMPHGTWEVLFRFTSHDFGSESQTIYLIALPNAPEQCGLPGRIRHTVVCFSSYGELLAIKNHLRQWFLLKTPEGEHGPWPWHEPAYIQLLNDSLSTVEKQTWLGPIDEIELIAPSSVSNQTLDRAHA